MFRLILAVSLALSAAAQTTIDLSRQARNIDFGGASFTRPLETGTTLPSQCSIGQMFFNSAAAAGTNVYLCTAANTWMEQGNESSLTFSPPFSKTGSTITCLTASGSQAGCLSSSDWATFQNKQPAITTGTASQYFKGDLSLGAFPTNLSQFTNGPGFISGNQTITFSGTCTGSGSTSISLTCGYAPATNGSGGQALTSNGLGGFGTPLTLPAFPAGPMVGTTDAQALSNKTLTAPSLGAGASPVTETWTVGAGGVTANTLVQADTSTPSNIVRATTGAYGVAMGTAAGGTMEIARYGSVNCVTDTGGATAGDLAVIGTGTASHCKDSGQTSSSAIPITSRIVGVFRSTATAGNMAVVELTPAHFGTQVGVISPGTAGQILIYNSDGVSAGPALCSISSTGTLSCGDGSTLTGIVLPELTENGTNSFSMYGAGSQSVNGCIVLSGQPTNGQILSATSSTTTVNGQTCVVMQWAAVPAPLALAATPTQCQTGNVATGVQANGNANCTPAASGGTVTSVNIAPPPGFAAGAAVTGSGNIVLSRALPGASTFYASDDFIGAGYNTSTTYVSSSAVYARGDIAGTGKIAIVAPLASSLGAWQLQSGATAGNASTLAVADSMGSNLNGFIPTPSATAYSYQTRVQLAGVANNYFGIGLFAGTGNLNQEFTASQAVWCDVTNTASAAAWACHSTNYSGTLHQTDVFTSSTADASPHVFLFVISTAEIDYYLDGSKIACINTGGTGGCTQIVTSGGAPNSSLTVYYEAKNSASTAASMNIDKWEVWQ